MTLNISLKKILKVVLTFVFILSGVNLFSQVINSRYDPFTYEELMRPIERQNNAFREAESDFLYNMEMAIKETKRENYIMTEYYLRRAQNINLAYDGVFFSVDELSRMILLVQQMIKAINQ
ncbi:MAG: hypothetical protein IKY58_00260 [Paludibacteraceae bacterium]|nr:hypothetical protein [Paludibacteraceae bacterium]